MKKTKKMVNFDNSLSMDFVFPDIEISDKTKTNNIHPVKKISVVDNKNKNKGKNVGIF